MNCATTNADILAFALFEMLGQKGAVRNADRIWMSTPQNRTLCVNLRKNSFVVAQFIAPLILKEKRRNELRDYER